MTTTDNLTTTERATAVMLVQMLTENTGRHILDSGGAYGRNWERNAGMTVEAALAAPAASWGFKGEYVTLDVFHFLFERLEYAPSMDARFQRFMDEGENAERGYMELMEDWAEQLTGDRSSWTTINTYNGEDALSQVIQYVQINTDGSEPLFGDTYLIQIHGGCDVRGGYTRPRVFLNKHPYDEAPLLENNDFEVWCDGATLYHPQTHTLPGFPDTPPEEIQHSWSFRAGESYDQDGNYLSTTPEWEWDEDADLPLCPECATLGLTSHLKCGSYPR